MVMKVRLVSYSEVEERFRDLLAELATDPRDESVILEKGVEAAFLLGVCISQFRAPNSKSYPGKEEHMQRLKQADDAIKYMLNTCTVEEISSQVPAACKAFGLH